MENLGWGLQITVLGMGLVFALLALLWCLLTLVLALDKEAKAPPSAHETQAEAERIAATAGPAIAAQTPAQSTVNGMPADLVAAIMVATMKHRLTLRREAAPLMRNYWPGNQLLSGQWVATGRARQNNSWQGRGK